MKIDTKSLSIRSKVVISILILTTLLTLVFYLIATQIILKSYAGVENDAVGINIKRVNYAIENLEKTQFINLKGWATWDDTYKFVQDVNNDFIANNLQINSFINFNLNFVAFLDNDGNVVFNKVVDLNTGEELNKEGLTNIINKQIDIFKRDTVSSGIMDTPYGLAIVSSAPILPSDGNGPMNGTIILGSFLSKDVTKKISDSILYPVDVFSNNEILPKDLILAKNNLSINNKSFIQILSDDGVAGYSFLYDLDNKPVAITKVTLPRDFYNKGMSTFITFTIITGIMFLLFGLGIIFLLEKLIIRRFTILNKEFTDISKSKDLTKRVTVDKDDEIGNLSSIINNIFNELNLSQEKERESHQLEKIATEELKKHMEETEKLNKLMVNRELKMIELNKKVEELERNKNN